MERKGRVMMSSYDVVILRIYVKIWKVIENGIATIKSVRYKISTACAISSLCITSMSQNFAQHNTLTDCTTQYYHQLSKLLLTRTYLFHFIFLYLRLPSTTPVAMHLLLWPPLLYKKHYSPLPHTFHRINLHHSCLRHLTHYGNMSA